MQTDAEERAANWRQVRRYIATFWVIIVFVFVAGLLTGAGAAAGWGIDNILLVWVFMMAFCCTSNAATDSPPASHDVEEKAPPTQRPAKRKRMHWLDNLKSCLICGVVLGHTCMAMWGTGAGIRFMHIDWNDRRYSAFNLLVYVGLCVFKPLVVPLFFFVSGYFAPSSLRRKGRASFLRSNAMRMGGVFLVFWLVFNPCMQFFGASLVRPTMYSPSYFPTSPHTWFLLWLLVFQTMYACLPFPSACTMPLPTFGPICRVGLTVALVQLLACILMLVCGSSLGLAEMPMNGPGGDGFFNALGFAAGVVARGSGWLSERPPHDLVAHCRLYVGVAVLLLMGLWGVICYGTVNIPEVGFLAVFLAVQIPLGPFCLAIIVVMLDFFMARCDFENALTRFMSNGAFAVFLIHYYVVNTCTALYARVLEEAGGLTIEFADISSIGCSTPIAQPQLFAGLIFIFVCSIVASFAIAAVLKMLPGLNFLL